MSDSIHIDQTLHGYLEGHHLISSSIILTNISKKKMNILSDLSGPEIQEGFKEYLTGYFLPEDNKYVLSYTWYADEMKRPGCVWTHSLIFEPKDMHELGNNIVQIVKLFRRPNKDDYNSYDQQIRMHANNKDSIKLNEKNMKYLIWAIWNDELPTIIPSLDSLIYKYEILYLWMHQNEFIDKNFAFSTGSLAIRRIESKILDIQIMPFNYINKFSSNKREYTIVHDQEVITVFPVWVKKAYELLCKDAWEDLNKFRNEFGKKYLESKYFSQFVKLYIGAKGDKFNFDIAEGLNISQQIFSVNEENIVNTLITLYLNKKLDRWIKEDNTLKLIIYLIKINKNFLNENQLVELVKQGLIKDINSSMKLIRYIVNERCNDISLIILNIYLESITCDMFINITNLELQMCVSMVKLHPRFAQCPEIWSQNEEFQKTILHSLKDIDHNDIEINNFLPIVFDNSRYDLSSEIYKLFGEKCIDICLDYLLGKKKLANKNTCSITDACKKHKDICLHRLSKEYKKMNIEQILLLLNIINIDSKKVIDENFKLWLDIFCLVSKLKLTDNDKRELALVYFKFIMKSIRKYPSDIIKFTYNVINDYLAKENTNKIYLDKIEEFLPKLEWYNNWDRCKRLQKAIKKKGYSLRDIDVYDNEDIDIHLL